MVALEDVLAHSDVMTADNGYSAPIPAKQSESAVAPELLNLAACPLMLTDSHHEAPLTQVSRGEEKEDGTISHTHVKSARNDMSP